jgi:hypothetical protein
MDKSSVTREAHHAAPRCLISLHEKANGTSLDGGGHPGLAGVGVGGNEMVRARRDL